jgi:hypothetical protein
MSQKNKVSVTRDKGKSYSSLNPGNPNLDSWFVAADVRMKGTCRTILGNLNNAHLASFWPEFLYFIFIFRLYFKIFFKHCIFVLTVPELLTVRSVLGSFSLASSSTQDNTPSMPLSDAHLGGFFFYTHG